MTSGKGSGNTGKRMPRVRVYGAGIAGLTVAHELSERGCKVSVVECERALDERDTPSMAIGGVARTQYAEATSTSVRDEGTPAREEGASARGWPSRRCSSDLSPKQARIEPTVNRDSKKLDLEKLLLFAPGDGRLSDEERTRVESWLELLLCNLPLPSQIHIEGYQRQGVKGLAEQRAKGLEEICNRVLRERFPLHLSGTHLLFPEITSTAAKPGKRANPRSVPERPRAKETVPSVLRFSRLSDWRTFVEDLKQALPRVRRIRMVAHADLETRPRDAARNLAERRLADKKIRLREALSSSVFTDTSFRVDTDVVWGPRSAATEHVEITVDYEAKSGAGETVGEDDRLLSCALINVQYRGPAQELSSDSTEAAKQVASLAEARMAQEGEGVHSNRIEVHRYKSKWKKEDGEDNWLLEVTKGSEYARGDVPLVAGGPLKRRPNNAAVAVATMQTGPHQLWVEFEPGKAHIPTAALEPNLVHVQKLSKAVAVRVTITSYVDADHEHATQELALRRATAVESRLRELLPPELLAITTHAMDPRQRAPRVPYERALPRDHGCVVLVEIQPLVLPGEHGFRFFPSYYNHVFDTMRRTPLLDDSGEETGWTVFDNVMPTPNQGVAQSGLSSSVMQRSPAGSSFERGERTAALRNFGYTPLDALQFMIRTLRYMCTCSERRARELERVSWWEYLQGYDPATRTCRYKYSDRFARDITTQSRTLASFDAVWGDARTCGNTWVQLFYNWLKPADKVDGTLNGPTSEAWFEPWKRYLHTRLGVRFVPGKLLRIDRELDRIRPYAWIPKPVDDASSVDGLVRLKGLYDDPDLDDDEGGKPQPWDYYVVATDARTAEAVVGPLLSKAHERIGVPAGLDGYTTRVRLEPPNPGLGRRRDPAGKYGVEMWDRFQTMSGVQFFFREDFKLNDGYVYFNRAPWGLTSINSSQFWEKRPTSARDGFVSVMSVDVCDWNARASGRDVVGKSAWECTVQDIGKEVWRQIMSELRPEPPATRSDSGWSGRWDTAAPPEPYWFHLDRNIELGRDPGNRDKPVNNRTPYLVPIKDDWQYRPGANPWDPTLGAFNLPPDYPKNDRANGEWQAEHGGYLVHWNKLVFAGVYLKTFTRMTTMEAANESGRHAANAILDHWMATHPEIWPKREPRADGEGRSQRRRGIERDDEPERVNESRHMHSSAFYTASPVGDYCKIWNPEHWEMPEFVQAKQADEWCFDRGLPHPWDVCGLENIPAMLSQTINARVSNIDPDKLGPSLPDALDAALEPLLRMAYPDGGWQSILKVVRSYRRMIDRNANDAAAAERGEPTPMRNRPAPRGPNRR